MTFVNTNALLIFATIAKLLCLIIFGFCVYTKAHSLGHSQPLASVLEKLLVLNESCEYLYMRQLWSCFQFDRKSRSFCIGEAEDGLGDRGPLGHWSNGLIILHQPVFELKLPSGVSLTSLYDNLLSRKKEIKTSDWKMERPLFAVRAVVVLLESCD